MHNSIFTYISPLPTLNALVLALVSLFVLALKITNSK